MNQMSVCVIVYNLYYCRYAITSSSAVQKRHSKVYGNPIAPSFYSILLGSIHIRVLLHVWLFMYTTRLNQTQHSWTLQRPKLKTFKKCVNIIQVYLFSVEGMIFCVFTKRSYAVHSSGNREGFKYLNRTPFCCAPVQNLNKEKEFVCKVSNFNSVLQI